MIEDQDNPTKPDEIRAQEFRQLMLPFTNTFMAHVLHTLTPVDHHGCTRSQMIDDYRDGIFGLQAFGLDDVKTAMRRVLHDNYKVNL